MKKSIFVIALLAHNLSYGQIEADFITRDRVEIHALGTTDTFDLEALVVTDLMLRTSPSDTTRLPEWMGTYGDVAAWVFTYGDNWIQINDDGISGFSLVDSSAFEIVVYEAFSFKVGDDFQRVREIFPNAAEYEHTVPKNGLTGLSVPFFVKNHASGKYVITASGISFQSDTSTDKISKILVYQG